MLLTNHHAGARGIATCQRCQNGRVADVLARVLRHVQYRPGEQMPQRAHHATWASGGADDIGLAYCLDRGQVQGAFPLPPSRLEDGGED